MSLIPKRPTENKTLDGVIEQHAQIRDESTGVHELGTNSTGLVVKGELLKQTQFNLPVSLNDRIAVVAAKFHAGNKSHFVRAALEEAVSRLEQLMGKQ